MTAASTVPCSASTAAGVILCDQHFRLFSLRWPYSDRLLDSVGIVLGTRGAPRSDLNDKPFGMPKGNEVSSQLVNVATCVLAPLVTTTNVT